MTRTLLRSFSSLVEARHAARCLTEAGISSSRVRIQSRLDETGGTESNFSVGNPETGRSGAPKFTDADNDEEYAKDFAAAKWSGTMWLTVELDDAEQEATATAALDGQGVDPDHPNHPPA